MSTIDHHQVGRLFNPTVPDSFQLKPFNASEMFGLSVKFPSELSDADKTTLNQIADKYENSGPSDSFDAFLGKIAEVKYDDLKSVESLFQKSATPVFNKYQSVASTFLLYHLFSRHLKEIESHASRALKTKLRKLAKALTAIMKTGSPDTALKSRRTGRLAVAMLMANQKQLEPAWIPQVYRSDPRFSFEIIDYTIQKKVIPNKGSAKTPAIKNQRLALVDLADNIDKLSEALLDALADTASAASSLTNQYKRQREELELVQPSIWASIANVFRRQPLAHYLSTTSLKKNTPEKNDKRDSDLRDISTKSDGSTRQSGDVIEDLKKWVMPLLIYKNIISSGANVNEAGSITNAKKNSKKRKAAIVLVSKNDARDQFQSYQDKLGANLPKIVTHFYFKANDQEYTVDLTNVASDSTLRRKHKEVIKIRDLIKEHISELCLMLQSQSEFPQFIGDYSTNDFTKLSFPSIALGLGELAVVRKRYIGWNYGGLAKIINKIPGSQTEVKTERIAESTIKTTTSSLERSFTASERREKSSKELNKAMSNVFNKEMAVEAGIRASYNTGMTKIEANANFSLNLSETKSQNINETHAKETVNRAVEEMTSEKSKIIENEVSEMIKQIESLVVSDAPEISYALAYVNDVFLFDVIRYGKRLMLELYIPEPAIGFIEKYINNRNIPPKPELFKGSLKTISVHDWACLQSRYPEIKIPQPPSIVTTREFKWAGSPAEEVNNNAEDIAEGSVPVPSGYWPEKVAVSIGLEAGSLQTVEFGISVSGRAIVQGAWSRLGDLHIGTLEHTTHSFHHDGVDTIIDQEVYLSESNNQIIDDDSISTVNIWEQGESHETIPITAKFFNHRDKAAFVNMLFYFRRMDEAVMQWKADVFTMIKKADSQRTEDYESNLIALKESVLVDTDRVVDEEDIKSELKKWFNKAMYGKPLLLDLIEKNSLEDDSLEPSFGKESSYLEFLRFDESFDWKNIRYIPLDKNFGERDLLPFKERVKSENFFVDKFVQAGAARLSVPIIPGRELWVLKYNELRIQEESKNKETHELLREAAEQAKIEALDESFKYFDVLEDVFRNAEGFDDFVKGVGKINVTKDSEKITYEAPDISIEEIDLEFWIPNKSDVGREIMIEGAVYFIEDVEDDRTIVLNQKLGYNTGKYNYLIGSQLVGKPWKVAVPSGEVKLLTKEQFEMLKQPENP